MKTRNSITGILAVPSIINSVAVAQNQAGGGHSFTIGNYHFRARQQQSNGLMRDVTINRVSGSPKSAFTIFAKFARKDPSNSSRWILGNVVARQYQSNGTPTSESIMTRLYINAGKQP